MDTLRPTYTWQAVGGATSYEVIVYNAAGQPLFVMPATGTSARGGAAFTPGASYRWLVRGRAADEPGPWSTALAFTAHSAPATPAPTGPRTGR